MHKDVYNCCDEAANYTNCFCFKLKQAKEKAEKEEAERKQLEEKLTETMEEKARLFEDLQKVSIKSNV